MVHNHLNIVMTLKVQLFLDFKLTLKNITIYGIHKAHSFLLFHVYLKQFHQRVRNPEVQNC